MVGKAVVDTNVPLYVYDRIAPLEQSRALGVLDSLVKRGAGVLTTQVLAEFYVNATRKLDPPLTPDQAYQRLQNYLMSWPILDLTSQIVLEAARGVRDYRMSYWDAQVWASARLNQIPLILSEDFDTGAVIEGVRFQDPLEETFDLDVWIPE